jgi:hypothetical protein
MKILLPMILPFLPAILFGQVPTHLPDLSLKAVTFTVVDTDGLPVEGALIEASRHGSGSASGYTGGDGSLTLELSAGGNLHVHVSMEGFYRTAGELWQGGLDRGPSGRLEPREVPDAFTIELKAVRDPVAMKHLRFRGRAPQVDHPAGYDLRVGDWVAPHGKGVTTDLLFHFHGIHNDGEDFAGNLTIAFPNEGDGIQPFTAARPFSMEFGSDLAPPHRAPVDGYAPELSFNKAHRAGEPYQGRIIRGRNYLFRTRTVIDPGGRLLQACYGWIQGEIEFDTRDPRGPQLSFAYFFNPDPDPESRSLEYNLHRPKPRTRQP